jgi:hypothetical protein
MLKIAPNRRSQLGSCSQLLVNSRYFVAVDAGLGTGSRTARGRERL